MANIGTNHLDTWNKILSYKFITINKQHEVYKTPKPQEKLTNVKAKKDSLKINIELLKHIKKLLTENVLLLAINNILNEKINDDNMNESKNDEDPKNENDLNNINDDIMYE